MNARTLRHPLWVGSLVLLVVNDHLLKGAAVLPAVVTGKLSDVAGLIVAPALLASFLPGTRRARIAAHVAVAVVFAALQLAPGLAAAWDASFAAVGVPWRTVPDPTDLLALPVLLLSWWMMESSDRAVRLARGESAPWLQAAGLAACIATGPGPGGETEWPTLPELEYQVALVNDGEEVLTVLTRELLPDVAVDCARLRGDSPGELLADGVFGVAVEWEMPPLSAIPALADPFAEAACHAVLVDGPELEPHVVFWEGRLADWQIADPEDSSGFAISLVTFDDLDRDLVFPFAPREDPECLRPSPLDGVDWAGPGSGTFTLGPVTSSPDGCLAVELGASEPLYLCMPEAQFGFAEGDEVEIVETAEQLVVAGSLRTLTLARLTSRLSSVDELTFRLTFDEGCGWRVDETCGHVTGEATVEVGIGDTPNALVTAGGPAVGVEGVGQTHVVTVTRAESRIVSVPECGRDAGPFDIDVIVETTLEP